MTNGAQVQKMLDFVEHCSDYAKLRQIACNARNAGEHDLHRAATLRLYSIMPAEDQDALEYDVWHSIHALEGSLSDERGKTIRLSRTRQKIKRDGELKTVSDLVLGDQSQGFDLLVERDMSHLTFEALTLKHSDRFDDVVQDAARVRLDAAGIDTGRR